MNEELKLDLRMIEANLAAQVADAIEASDFEAAASLRLIHEGQFRVMKSLGVSPWRDEERRLRLVPAASASTGCEYEIGDSSRDLKIRRTRAIGTPWDIAPTRHANTGGKGECDICRQMVGAWLRWNCAQVCEPCWQASTPERWSWSAASTSAASPSGDTPRTDEKREVARKLGWNEECVWEWAEQLERELSVLQRGAQSSGCAMRFTGGETWVCDACGYRGDHDEKPDCAHRTGDQK
jgi:rubrerythrin